MRAQRQRASDLHFYPIGAHLMVAERRTHNPSDVGSSPTRPTPPDLHEQAPIRKNRDANVSRPVSLPRAGGIKGRLFCLRYGHPIEGEVRLTHCPSCGKLLTEKDLPEGWR